MLPIVFDWLSLTVLGIGMIGHCRSQKPKDGTSVLFLLCLTWACVRMAAPTVWWVLS